MATPKKAPPKKPAAKKPDVFRVKLTVAGKTYEATGYTAIEAITALEPRMLPKVRAIMVVTNGTYKREMILPPYAVMRLFSLSRVMREVALKNISLLFGL